MKVHRGAALAVLSAGLLALAACGGGGSSGGTTGGSVTSSSSSSSSSSPSSSASSSSSSSSSSASASAYVNTALTADVAGAASHTDTNLVNGWGLAFNPAGFAWVADQGTSKSTLYDGNGVLQTPVVTIPKSAAGVGGPTGIVTNTGSAFNLTVNNPGGVDQYGYPLPGGTSQVPALFIFDTIGGTIAAWSASDDPNNAVTMYDSGGTATYTGLAILTGSTNRLYAADFRNNKIDVFDGTFAKITASGGFADPNIPAGYSTFGIQGINGQLYVTYAQVDTSNGREKVGAGLGYVDIFDSNGTLVKRLISNGALNAPWGLVMAPAGFGTFSGDLLVGNFGDGTINAYDPSTGTMVGTIKDATGANFAVPGLWGIAFGNGINSLPATTLFYAAGTSGETHGVFGRIDFK